MILIDTSIWIDHFRHRIDALASLLEKSEVLTHPFVIGELALGVLANRQQVIKELKKLPSATIASNTEIIEFIDGHALAASGIGLVDAHLLAAARLTPGAGFWTRDKRLSSIAARLGLSADL